MRDLHNPYGVIDESEDDYYAAWPQQTLLYELEYSRVLIANGHAVIMKIERELARRANGGTEKETARG
jgi:hypothetical protein